VVASLDGLDEASAVGVGVPGPVVDGTLVVRCPNIAGWDTPVDVGREVAEALGKPVVVGNDANCGAVAEHRVGAGAGLDDLLAVFVGTGVGSGLIIDGALVDGERGLGGEIGHTTVVPGGRPCGCGGRGHLEAYAGRAGIERRARELAGSGRRSRLVELAGTGMVKSRHLAQALDDGDEVAVELVDEAVEALALVIGNAATLLDLRRVVLGGGVVDKLGRAFVDRIASSQAFGGLGPEMCELRLARRLDDAGVVGAALLAADRFG
jgi:glucokinase